MTTTRPIRSIGRGLQVLRAVNRKDGLRAPEIAEMTRIPRPTVYRILYTLESQGFVVRGPSDDVWQPTLLVQSLSSGYLEKSWVGQLAMPEMMKLGKAIIWPVDLVTYVDYSMLVRQSTHSVSPFSFDVGMVGTVLPMLHTAGGHAYLGFCPENERRLILDGMRSTGLPEHQLAHDETYINLCLERTRAAGFGLRIDGHYKSHTFSISAPIIVGNKVLAALTVVWLKSAMKFDEFMRRHSGALRQTADTIAAKVAETESLEDVS